MMKKCYALLMAIVMVVSAGSMVFAASTSDGSNVKDSGVWDSGVTHVESYTIKEAVLTVDNVTYRAKVNKTLNAPPKSTRSLRSVSAPTGVTEQAVKDALNGVTFRNVEIDGSLYAVKLNYNATNGFSVTIDPALPKGTNVNMSLSVTGSGRGETTTSSGSTVSLPDLNISFTVPTVTGTDTKTTDYYGEIENLAGVRLRDVVLCDAKTNMPVPLTENNSSAEKGDRNDIDGVRSGSTVYFMIKDGGFNFDNDLYWKLRISKGNNGKYIKKISDVSKTFSKGLYNATDKQGQLEVTKGRHRYIKVELNEIYTDDEYKITLDLRLTPKQKAVDVFGVNDDAQIKVKDFYFYMKNSERSADNEWTVGTKGLMLNPLENDWNEVTYYDEDGDVAFMRFFADSDVDKFFAKLSTKWEHADYASYFNDQDSFVFNFTGSPKISSTSRCDLQIYNPFIDDDGNETIDPTTAVIYQVIDGDLYDVTDSFTYEEGDNGDMAYVCRTRFLGTYIICEKSVEEAL